MKTNNRKTFSPFKGIKNFFKKKTGAANSDADVQSPAKAKKKRRPWTKKRKIVVFSVIGFVVMLAATGTIYAYTILHDPMGQFDSVAEQASNPTATPKPTESIPDTTDGPTPTIDPYDALVAEADFSMLKNIVNIMLIGVDHATERDTWSGKKAFHSDVMIVLSINTDTNKVSMISLPRDTYAKIPGVGGIYKLNASIDCGGGWPTDDGFNKVCEAAEWMLGGIPVDYYYAVDMGAVKGLVDAIDGVDYELDLTFKIQGRSYKEGYQHMDGQAVLDYLRVRKAKNIKNASGKTGDLRRIDRQKRMLVAIFQKIKEQGLLTSIPDLLSAFDGNLYTNTTFGQTAALAAYAFEVDSDDISMYSMSGSYLNIFNWNFVLTNQTNRVEIIKEVYNYDAPKYSDYTMSGAKALWAKMQQPLVTERSGKVLNKVKALLDADALLLSPASVTKSILAIPKASPNPSSTAPTPTPTAPTPTPTAPTPTPTAPTPTPTDPTPTPTDPTPTPTDPTPTPTDPTPTPTATPDPDDYQQYGEKEWNFYYQCRDEYKALKSNTSYDAVEQLKKHITSLCHMFGLDVPSWRVNYEKNSNEIYIDFN